MRDNGNLVQVKNLKKYFKVEKGVFARQAATVKAVDGVSLSIRHGETLGLVGESGCGKTTLGRVIILLERPTEGEIFFRGRNVAGITGDELMQFRKSVQIIFQDPYSSLNPRKSAGSIIGESIMLHEGMARSEREQRVAQLMEIVGLNREQMSRYPHEFSGGQRQRIGIARALALRPELVIADEPVSALDVSIQAQILNLMKDLQERFALTYLLISHDLGVVEHMSNRIAVMYLGRIVEIGRSRDIAREPLHPYTRALLSAVPVPKPGMNKSRIILQGDVPTPLAPPSGCAFNQRCARKLKTCDTIAPALVEFGNERAVACHLMNNNAG